MKICTDEFIVTSGFGFREHHANSVSGVGKSIRKNFIGEYTSYHPKATYRKVASLCKGESWYFPELDVTVECVHTNQKNRAQFSAFYCALAFFLQLESKTIFSYYL